jgi:hypothetical protein
VAPAAAVAPPPAPAAGDGVSVVVSRLRLTLYGFVQLDMAYNSTESCAESCSNALIQKPGTYRGDHGRVVFSPRDSRFGIRIAGPEAEGLGTSGVLETDFFGPTATTEQGMFSAPVLRVRQAYLKLETPIVDVLVGQAWNLFGWQATYLVTSAQEPGYPGELTQRTSQVRISKTVRTGAVDVELATAAERPPQMDSATPEWVVAARVVVPGWTGRHGGAVQPASLAVSADLRRFRVAALAANPGAGHVKFGGGVAIDGYLPIIAATPRSQDNALSLIGEAVIGAGISDAYTALGAAGTSPSALPAGTTGAGAVAYTPNFDPGLAAYDAAGHLELIQWRSYMLGAEYFPPGVGGRLWTFANHGHMASPNARRFGDARTSEDFDNAGAFVDVTSVVRVGADAARYADHYLDGTTARNYSAMVTAYLFF